MGGRVDEALTKLRVAIGDGLQSLTNKPDGGRTRRAVFGNLRYLVDELEAAIVDERLGVALKAAGKPRPGGA